MKKKLHIQAIASIFLTFFLFVTSTSFYYSSSEVHKDVYQLIISKKANSQKASDCQFPMEEKEGEDGNEDELSNENNDLKNHLGIFYFTQSTFYFNSFQSQFISLVNSQNTRHKTSHLPLFISNRSILI